MSQLLFKPRNQLNVQIPEEMSQKLKKEKKKTGVPVSEIVRRAIKAYLDKSSATLTNK